MLDNFLSQVGLVIGGVVLALILLVILTIKNLIVIVPPNIAAIITGRKRVSEEGGDGRVSHRDGRANDAGPDHRTGELALAVDDSAGADGR
jgi:hypothetical protein